MRGKAPSSFFSSNSIKDHPRLCGEKHNKNKPQIAHLGSPPPMRGKVFLPDQTSDPKRITPAYAGKSAKERKRFSREKDHPRLCGEKLELLFRSFSFLGSPPPMRGKVVDHKDEVLAAGITPAYAGKSRRSLKTRPATWDHPRLCGEKSPAVVIPIISLGSPPPMRGKVFRIRQRFFVHRIPPAYAGKSSYLIFSYSTHWDHPRLCGEKLMCRQKTERQIGSPPPMRGKDLITRDKFRRYRITPAYAGKSLDGNLQDTQALDHPRLCGEKYMMNGVPVEETRITPAYAGKSGSISDYIGYVKDHPRLCGEKLCFCCCDLRCQGSPPPMRGKG